MSKDKDMLLLGEEDAIEKNDITEKTNTLIKEIQKRNNPWGTSFKADQARRLALSTFAVKNGMHARIPLVCKAENCPYADQCQLLPYGMAPEGEYCAVELAQIELRAAGYSQDIDYDTASFTDKNLMSELITLDVMLERCKALLAKDGTPVIDMAIGVDQEGNEIRQPSVSKAWEAYEKISKKRDQTYQLLMMTRKDRRKDGHDDDALSVSDALHSVIESADVEA